MSQGPWFAGESGPSQLQRRLHTVVRAAAASDLFNAWGAPQTATLLAALIAVLGVAATILTTTVRAAREHRTTLFADALGAVADYNEGPYRIRRKGGTSTHRNAITSALSDVKSSIDHNQELLRLHARKQIADANDRYVCAAKAEAGQQMHDAWELDPITEAKQVNLSTGGYERGLTATYRSEVVRIMQIDLARRWYRPRPLLRYLWFCPSHLEPPPRPIKTTPLNAPGSDKSHDLIDSRGSASSIANAGANDTTSTAPIPQSPRRPTDA